MEKMKINYLLDLLLFISLLAVATTGIIKTTFVLHLLNLTKNAPTTQTLSSIHDISGVVLTLLVLIHLILHWNWIICVTKSILKPKNQSQ